MKSEQKETPALDSWAEYVRDHPLRARIGELLARGVMETDELVRLLGVSRRQLAYHRGVLEMAAPVTGVKNDV